MDKPYTTVQRDDYQLTIYSGTAPLDPNNDNVDVQVTFPKGESFSAVFFTLQNIDTLMKKYKKTGECATACTSGHLIPFLKVYTALTATSTQTR